MRAGGTDTFERFTERARQVVVLAQDEARRLGHSYIGTEHLLLGLVREQEGLAARVLDTLGVTLGDARAAVVRNDGRGDVPPTGQIPFTPRAKETLERALREAIAMQHRFIGTEHILLGLAGIEDCVGARILRELGAESERVRTEVIRTLSGPTGDYEHAVDTFTRAEELVDAAARWQAEGWEIRSITVQRRRTRTP